MGGMGIGGIGIDIGIGIGIGIGICGMKVARKWYLSMKGWYGWLVGIF